MIEELATRIKVNLTDAQWEKLHTLRTGEVLEALEALRFYQIDWDYHFGQCILATFDHSDKGMKQKMRYWVRTNLGTS
jgi:hypothetical protein